MAIITTFVQNRVAGALLNGYTRVWTFLGEDLKEQEAHREASPVQYFIYLCLTNNCW